MMNLQMFATPVKGKKMVYLFRVYDNRATDNGTLLAFVTQNSRSTSVDSDTTDTKDGKIRTPGSPEITINSTSILPVGDAMIGKLDAAMLDNKIVECWEANLEEAGSGTNKYKGMYYQGYITSLEVSSPADGNVEITIEYGVNGKGASGDVTVTDAQQEIAQLVFADTTATGATGATGAGV